MIIDQHESKHRYAATAAEVRDRRIFERLLAENNGNEEKADSAYCDKVRAYIFAKFKACLPFASGPISHYGITQASALPSAEEKH
jgi:hypothetical protein